MAPQLEIVRQPAPPRGLFITLEGGEGSGKSSQAQTIKALLEERGYRVADSSVAYQGHGRGLGLNHVRVANLVATQGLLPDLTIVLNVAVDLGLSRKEGETAPDRIGRETPDFHERVRRGYLALATEAPKRFVGGDGTLSPKEITERIWRRLEP